MDLPRTFGDYASKHLFDLLVKPADILDVLYIRYVLSDVGAAEY
jgi:hypothetical protein